MKLTDEEKTRYLRHIIIPEIGEAGQELIKSASVLLIGAGGLGSPIAYYLTAGGIGKLGIIDDDIVDLSNLQRQILYTTPDYGKKKVDIAKEKLNALNPNTTVNTYPVRLTEENAVELIKPYHIIIDGSDNYPTRYLINDTCVKLNKPFVSASVFHLGGQLGVFNYRGGSDYRALYPEPPTEDESRMLYCDNDCHQPGILGVVPGILGTLAANEVFKMILGFDDVLSDQWAVFDAATCELKKYRL